MSYTPPTFSTEKPEEWLEFLDIEGYVVLSDILSPDELHLSMELFKSEWSKVSPNFEWDNPKDWSIKNCPLMFGKGMAIYSGFGQSDFMWSLRTHPKIIGIFENIHGVEDLVVSLDGFSVFISDKQQTKSWLHIDQNPKTQAYSIQGSFNFLPVGEKDSGFVVVPGSHKSYHPEVPHKRDWFVVDQKTFLPQAKKLLIPGNCFVLWNSKTIHASTGMTKGTMGLNRVTAYITYLPKYLRTKEMEKKRKQAYMDSRTTSHWANKCELKPYPFGFKSQYESKGFAELVRKLDRNGNIPEERLNLI
jgi:ectoine hydroxylase-related dioxygenase (phytanoyl-CoA dioxygenase family)